MKKLLGIVVLGLFISSHSFAIEKIFVEKSSDINGGTIFVLGPSSKKNGLREWGERIRTANPLAKSHCLKYNLKHKPFKLTSYKPITATQTRKDRKYIGKTYNSILKKNTHTWSTDKYSEQILVASVYEFECINDKPKKSDANKDLIGEIEKLKVLYEEGTLTKEQFEKAKDKLLN
ncbi:SHOCT domain-containing protein [Pelagibacterales bacterium SAG-MED15]|nr:SHOCT domain-containing protein [Pelagibacterales bacterium SAG-MED15]